MGRVTRDLEPVTGYADDKWATIRRAVAVRHRKKIKNILRKASVWDCSGWENLNIERLEDRCNYRRYKGEGTTVYDGKGWFPGNTGMIKAGLLKPGDGIMSFGASFRGATRLERQSTKVWGMGLQLWSAPMI